MKLLPITLLALLLAGCTTLPVTTLPVTTQANAGPHTCTHPWITWSRWQDQSIGTLVKQTRTRGCRVCGWSQAESRLTGVTP